jgi:hypothetical protein
MAVDLAFDAKGIGVFVVSLVAAGGSRQQQQIRARRELLAMPLGVTCRATPLNRRGRFVAKQLLDRVWNQCRVVHQLPTFTRVLREKDARPAHEARDGLVARAGK